MLEFLRKSAGSWVAKILFGLLILSFGVWGIGDVVRGGGDQVAAIEVGEIEVGPQYIRQQFDQRMERLRQVLGDEVTNEQAIEMGFLQATVQEIVASTTLDMAARDLGIAVSDDALRDALRQTPAFQSQDGTFAPDLFRRVLAANNLTEERYLNLLRGDISRQRLATALGTGAAPGAMVDRLFAYRQEERSAEVLRIDASRITLDEAPSQEALRAIYDAQISSFTAPEYREGVAILLRQEDLLDRVEVTDQAIEDYYETNRARYTTPPRRDVTQVIADDRETAAEVAQIVRGGASLAEAAAQAGATAPIDTGPVARDGLPPAAAEAVFDADAGAVTDPVESPLGWHVFRVNKVMAGAEQALSEVRDAIRQEIARERAVDVLYEESAQLEDALGGGATLEEAAERLDLPRIDLPAVDIDGQTMQGQSADLPEGEAGDTIVRTLFELEQGLDSRLREIPGGYAVVRVDEVTPPAPRPFETVESTVRQIWERQQRQDKAKTLAAELADQAAGPFTLESLAERSDAVTLSRSEGLTRAAAEQGATDLPTPLVNRLFSLQPGQVAWEPTAQGAAVARLADVAAADPAAKDEARAALAQALRGQIGQDLMAQAIQAYGNRYGVTINQGAIQQAF